MFFLLSSVLFAVLFSVALLATWRGEKARC